MPERPTKEEIEAFEIRYLKDMADRYGGQLEAEAARRRARLKEKARRARETNLKNTAGWWRWPPKLAGGACPTGS